LKFPDDSDEEDDSLSYALYTDSGDDELSDFEEPDDPVDMEQLKWTIQQAKDDAIHSINHYVEKANRTVDDMFDRFYYDIRDGAMAPPRKYKPKKGPSRTK
jgi:hypothetical protein